MRKEIVLAAAVLSVLAGLLTIGYARNRDDDGPDAFELRRLLLDRIETAVSEDDTAMLDQLVQAGAAHDRFKAMSEELLQQEQDRETDDGLHTVSSAIGENPLFSMGRNAFCKWLGRRGTRDCGSEYTNCLNYNAQTTQGQPLSAYPLGEQRCEIEYEQCKNRALSAVIWCMELSY